MDGWMYGWMDGWMDGWSSYHEQKWLFFSLECKMNTVCVCALITKAASDE